MVINEECISCNACVDECPNNAIYYPGAEYQLNGEAHAALSEDHPYIVKELCDDCKSCSEVCPTESIME